jgi:hypothetical protein
MRSSLFAVGLAIAQTGLSAGNEDKGYVPIREEMNGLYQTMTDLLPLVVSKAQFENPKNTKAISKSMNKLSALTHTMVKNSQKFEDNDPSIRFISEKFADDIDYAIQMWNTGDREIPRRLLRTATDYCVSCHSRTAKGAHFSELGKPPQFSSLPALTKAEFYAATRQYSSAIKQFEHVIIDKPLAKLDPMAWNLSVKRLLAITVRVEQNPSLTMEMISRIQDNPESSRGALKSDLTAWRADAKEWSAEKETDKNLDQAKSMEKAKKLLEIAQQRSKTSTEDGGLIPALRASALMHGILGGMKYKGQTQEMLALAGDAAWQLRELNLWSMQDIYYEGCIRKNSDADRSKHCMTNLEESFLRNYGVHSVSSLPQFAQNRLNALKKLSGHRTP